MSTGFEIIDHPSDTGIKVVAGTAEELFEIAAAGMFSLITRIEKVEPLLKKKIRIVGKPGFLVEDMLIIWLEELLYIHETKKMLFSRFKVTSLIAEEYGYKSGASLDNGSCSGIRETLIEAEIFGERIDLNKHEVFISIKAPTYHMLEINRDKNSGLWKCQVIFDV